MLGLGVSCLVGGHMSTWKCVNCEHVRRSGSSHCPLCGSTNAVNTSALPPDQRRPASDPRQISSSDLSEITHLLASSLDQQKRLVAAQERAAANTERIKWAVWALLFCLVGIPTLVGILWSFLS